MMMKFICLLDSKKYKEMGMPDKTMEAKISIDMHQVESFREAFDGDGELIPNEIMVEMKSDAYHCLKTSYDEFETLYFTCLPEKKPVNTGKTS